MNKALISTVGVICLLSAQAWAAEDNEKTSRKPSVTFTGDDSRVSERAFHRIVSLDDWAKVWVQHTGQNEVQYKNWDNHYDDFYNPLKLPLVDFENYMVIAIFQGSSWNNAGLNAVSISEKADGISFRFEDKPYSTEGPDGGGKKVNVYGFFVIPRSTKPITLEEKVLRMKNEKFADKNFDKSKAYAADWVQRIKFAELK